MSLADIGEADLLRLLAEVASAASNQSLVVGPGDDAAVWRSGSAVDVVLTQDAMVEDRDFRRVWITPQQIGARALHVALSDIAGMGAGPAWCLATLCAPGATLLDDVLEIQRGLVAAARDTGCALAGGDVSDTAGPIVIDVAVGGTLDGGRCLRRDAGRPGDVLVVTGTMGRAAAGLRALDGAKLTASEPSRTLWEAALLAPRARIAEGLRLAEAGARCGGDISDGLAVDAARTADASGCAAEVWLDHVPVDPDLRTAFSDAWVDIALGGGDDFELLAALSPVVVGDLLRGWPTHLAPLRIVGRLVEGSGVEVLTAEGGDRVAGPVVSSRHWR